MAMVHYSKVKFNDAHVYVDVGLAWFKDIYSFLWQCYTAVRRIFLIFHKNITECIKRQLITNII